jgi:hypothetical protein
MGYKHLNREHLRVLVEAPPEIVGEPGAWASL